MTIRKASFIIVFVFFLGASSAFAQNSGNGGESGNATDESGGISLPNTEHVKMRVRFMAGYGLDEAQSSLGFDSQGRVGYAIIELFGIVNNRFSYRLEINPMNEVQPLPSCGEEGFFYPNIPQNFGPNVACDNNGRTRVDDYRFIALDTVLQQGLIRQAYLQYKRGPVGVRFGRFLLPIGLDWEKAGSLTAKDATHIQRINTESNFGTMMTLGGKRVNMNVATFVGDGNRFHDYDYFYSLDGTLDSNSALTSLLSGSVKPVKNLEFLAAWKYGFTGSKVERLPNYFASKRNDMAAILSTNYRPVKYVSVFGEYASYTWGITKTSAELVGFTDGEPVKKNGYYVGTDLAMPISDKMKVGAVITREELSRDDALVKLLASGGLYGVEMGKKERTTTFRIYTDLSRLVRVGFYRSLHSNPYPWVSGIVPVEGERAFKGRGSDKWGLVVRFTLD